MYREERQKLLLDYVNDVKKASVKELSEKFNTSEVTIRSDILSLHEKGLLLKMHGGAIANVYKINSKIPSEIKFKSNIEEKKKIAKIASRYVEDNSIIILDSGTTTLELAKILEMKNLTIYTNDLQIAMEIAKKRDCTLNVAGGELISSVYTLAGYETENYFKTIRVEKLFISCDAIDVDFGISCRNVEEVSTKLSMMQAAGEIILMVDHTKIGQAVVKRLCSANVVSKLIVDEITNEEKKKFENLGIEVITE